MGLTEPIDKIWFDSETTGTDTKRCAIVQLAGLVEIGGDMAYDLFTIRDSSVRGPEPDISALASRNKNKACIMVWNYHDDNILLPASPVNLRITGIPGEKAVLRHYRIDQDHSNAFERWKEMGSPQQPSAEQYGQLERAGQMEMMGSPQWANVNGGRIVLNIDLPVQAVSFFEINWQAGH